MEAKEKQEKRETVRAFLELSCKVSCSCNLSNRLNLFRELDNAKGNRERIKEIEEAHPEIHFYRALHILEHMFDIYSQAESVDYTESDLERIRLSANKIWTCIYDRRDFCQAIENFEIRSPFVYTEVSDTVRNQIGIHQCSLIDKYKFGDIAGTIDSEIIPKLLGY